MSEFFAEYFSWIQIIGYVGMAFALISYQFKKNKTYFFMQTMCAVSFSIQFAILHSWTGMFLNIFSIFRGVIFMMGDKCRKKVYLVIAEALFLISFLLSVFVFKEAWYLSLIVFLAQAGGTLAMWTRNGKTIRIAQISFISPLWLIYDAVNGSVGGVLCEIFNMISVIVSFFRFKKSGYDKT